MSCFLSTQQLRCIPCTIYPLKLCSSFTSGGFGLPIEMKISIKKILPLSYFELERILISGLFSIFLWIELTQLRWTFFHVSLICFNAYPFFSCNLFHSLNSFQLSWSLFGIRKSLECVSNKCKGLSHLVEWHGPTLDITHGLSTLGFSYTGSNLRPLMLI